MCLALADSTTYMSLVRTIRLADVDDQPWKNGGGTTRPLANGRGWRISLATVAANGQFSVFDGWWRHSIVVAGDGLRLESASTAVSLSPHRAVSYDGGASWSCTLEGETASVLNVMCESRVATATLQVTRKLRMNLQGPIVLLPVNCSGICHVDGNTSPFLIPQGSFLLSDTQGPHITCRTDGESSAESSYLLAIQIESLTVDK